MDTPASTAAPSTRGALQLTFLLLGVVAVLVAIFAASSSTYGGWYALFKTVHVTFAMVWIGGGLLLTILAIIAEQKNDADEIAIVARQAAFVGERIFAPAGLIVFLMGVAMMLNTDWGWGKFWVVAGLIGYATTFTTGIGVLSPLTKRVHTSIEANGATHPETIALIRRTMLIVRFDVALLLLVVADMITKPFS
jgi:uncharacterized membrane protein